MQWLSSPSPAVPDDETFAVKLRKSSTLRFSGQCLLEILRDFDRNLFHVALFTKEQPPRLIVKWQIDHIRQYGSNDVAFKFQSGRWGVPAEVLPAMLSPLLPFSLPRKAPTGVDWFIVDTEPGVAMRIHRAVDYWAQHIVEQVANMQGHGASLVSPPLANKLPLILPPPSQPRSSRKPSSPSSPLPSPSTPSSAGGTPHGPIYTGLRNETKNTPSLYDNPHAAQHGSGSAFSPPATSPTASLYQPLQPHSSSFSHNDSTYEVGLPDCLTWAGLPDLGLTA